MIFNIEETPEYIRGTVKDLKQYFRYKIASLCMTGNDCDYESFITTIKNIIDLLDNLYDDTILTDTVEILEQPMGGYWINILKKF